MKRKSFKSLEHEIVMILGRHGYKLNTKLPNKEADTRIYTKGVLEGCVLSVHRGDTSSLTVTFSDNYIQMNYSALVAITFDINADIKYIVIDHTDNRKYYAVLTEINHFMERI